jgi:tetratricopeptide (TPR) repeat protein
MQFMTDLACVKCGKPVRSNDRFCSACGHPVSRKAESKSERWRDHLIILGIVVVVTLAYFGYQALVSDNAAVGEQQPPQASAGIPVDMNDFVSNLPTDFASLVSMGNALMDQRHFEMAIECYSRALEQHPEDANLRVDLGACQHSLGLNSDAIRNFTKALEYDPGHHVAKFNLGIVHYSSGELDQAIEWWNRLLAENPPEELKTRAEELLKQAQNN